MKRESNKNAGNGACTSLLHILRCGRAVPEAGRSAAVDRDQKDEYEYAISSL